MKKIVCLTIIAVLLVVCGTRRSLNIDRLRTGMTKAQVENIAGSPDRLIAVRETDEGYQEVLGYWTSGGEMYALEFWDDYLTGYEYLYDEVQYYPSPYPAYFPPYGRPIYMYSRDPRPPYYGRPPYNNRPNYNNNNRPGTTNPGNTDRPGNTNRPGTGNNTSPGIQNPSPPDTNRSPDRTTVTPGNNNSNSNTGTSSNRSNRSQQ
ncbi:MAG: outer membrane protein assembly factor BamE [Tannerellaceae bacterium]|nr:outer membrane protein assembly factor BamE [Tannerellaceae bacterium]